jgi:hypothetical protein
MQTTVRLYGALSKVEEQADGAIVVVGTASSGARDEQGEVITPDAMKAALPDYLKWGAIREMHQPHAAGTALGAEVQDDGRTLIEAHIVDPEAVRKVKARVYKGFSVGGKVLARDPQDRSVITKIRLSEISLVDRPCNPEAAIDLWKAEQGGDEASDRHDQDGAHDRHQGQGYGQGQGLVHSSGHGHQHSHGQAHSQSQEHDPRHGDPRPGHPHPDLGRDHRPGDPMEPAPRMTSTMTSAPTSAYVPSNQAVRARAEHLAKAAGRPAARYADYVVKARAALVEQHAAGPFAALAQAQVTAQAAGRGSGSSPALAEIAAAPRLDKFAPSPRKKPAAQDQDANQNDGQDPDEAANPPLHPAGGRWAGGSDGGPRNGSKGERPTEAAQAPTDAQPDAKPNAPSTSVDQDTAHASDQPQTAPNTQASAKDSAAEVPQAATPAKPAPAKAPKPDTQAGARASPSEDDDAETSDATDAETIQAIHDQAHALGAVCDPDNAPDPDEQDDSAEDPSAEGPAKPAAQPRLARMLTGAGLRKVGARNSQDDAAIIQGVHDNAVILGAVCACAPDDQADDAAPGAPAQPAEPPAQKLRLARDLAKARAETDRLAKALADAEPRLERLNAAWETRFATLEKAFQDLPRPGRTAGSAAVAVSKAQDALGPRAEETPDLNPDAFKAYLDALPDEERGMLLMKAALRQPMGVRRG